MQFELLLLMSNLIDELPKCCPRASWDIRGSTNCPPWNKVIFEYSGLPAQSILACCNTELIVCSQRLLVLKKAVEIAWRGRKAFGNLRDSTPMISRRVSQNITPKSIFRTTQPSITIHQFNNMPRKTKKDIDLEDMVDDEQPPEIEPYAVLGLEKTATPDDIKSAYRKAALKHHPGMCLICLLHTEAAEAFCKSKKQALQTQS